MKTKKIPLRTCVVTHEKLPKQDLVRIVRTTEGSVIIDETGRSNGRGAYLKKDLEVFNKAKQSKILNRHLEVEVPDIIFEKLGSMINEEN